MTTEQRDAVLRDFQVGLPPDETHDAVALADEIVRLRERLATAAPVVPVVTEAWAMDRENAALTAASDNRPTTPTRGSDDAKA
jgi:hypothetical protein